VFEITCAVVYARVRRADDDTPDVFRNVMTKTQTDSKKLSYGRSRSTFGSARASVNG
jgi:hypothetical protein